MSFLMLYVGENQQFDANMIKSALQQSPNTSNLRLGTRGTLFECEYHVGDDFTKIRLKDDLETIVVDGVGPSSLQAVLEIQDNYDRSLHLIDEGYTFDIVITECQSLNDLLDRITEAGS